jgi:hypothetical protein
VRSGVDMAGGIQQPAGVGRPTLGLISGMYQCIAARSWTPLAPRGTVESTGELTQPTLRNDIMKQETPVPGNAGATTALIAVLHERPQPPTPPRTADQLPGPAASR